MHITGNENLTVVDGGKSIIGAWTRQAGGRSAFPELDSAVEVGLEEVIKVNPDVITVGGPNAARAVTEIKQSPRWQSISAVKNNRIFVNPMGTSCGIVIVQKKPCKFFGPHRFFIQTCLKI